MNYNDEPEEEMPNNEKPEIVNKKNSRQIEFASNTDRTATESEILVAKATFQFRSHNFREAITLIKQAEEKINEKMRTSRNNLRSSGGMSKLIKKDHVKDEEKLLSIIFCKKSRVLYELDDIKEAIAAANSSLELQPDNWKSHRNKANCLLRLGLFEQAIESYDKAL